MPMKTQAHRSDRHMRESKNERCDFNHRVLSEELIEDAVSAENDRALKAKDAESDRKKEDEVPRLVKETNRH
jgi:hypothetical protein